MTDPPVEDPWPSARLLAFSAFVAYLPALRGGFTWADDLYVSDAPQLRSLSHLWETWASPGLHHGGAAGYLPLTYTAFWVQSHFWHTWPWGYHAVNVALHVLNAALVWRLLRRLQVPGSLLAALIFALHPVQVESVAWISQLKNLLSALFYLLSMACLLRFFGIKGSEDAHNEEHGHRRWYALAILSFLLAIGAGGIVFTLPAAVLLILWWKTGRIQPRDASILAPLFVIGVASGIFMARMKGLHFGIGGKEALEPFLLAGRGLWFYAGKLAWPSRLSFAYPRWNIDPLVWWQYLFPLSALAAVGALWRLRSDLGRGPLAAVLFFAGTLAPHLGSAGMSPEHYSCVADHFPYLASTGLIALAAAIAATRLRASPLAPRLGAMLMVLLVSATAGRARVFQDPLSLWSDALQKDPSSWIAHENLAATLGRVGRTDESVAHWREAVRLKPNHADAQRNVGKALLAQGRFAEAAEHYREALRLHPSLSDARDELRAALAGQGAEEHYGRGLQLHQRGQIAGAIAQYQEALRLKPDFAEAHNDLGVALLARGQVEEAAAHYRQALQIKPDFPVAHNNLGIVLQSQGATVEAIGHFEQALRLKPDFAEAQFRLGTCLEAAGRLAEAIEQYRMALQSQSSYPEARSALAAALGRQRSEEEAIARLAEAVRLQPRSAQAHYSLGLSLHQHGRLVEAAAQYRQALRINPDDVEAHNNLGVALFAGGRAAEAIAHYRRALQSKLDFAPARYNMGLALQSLGKTAEAVEQYRQALRLKPDYAEAHLGLAGCLDTLKRPTEALENYRAALRINPGLAAARDGVKRHQQAPRQSE